MRMINDILHSHWLSWHGWLTLLSLLIYLTASRIQKQRRHPSAAMAWVLSLVLMPYLALPVYLLFGKRKIARGRDTGGEQGPAFVVPGSSPLSARLQTLGSAMGLPAACGYTRLVLHEDGRHARQRLLCTIDEARHTLDIGIFLIGRDQLGRELLAHLMARARAGVKVRLLIDGLGYYLGGRPDLDPLAQAGGQIARFVSPLGSALPGRTNLRNHRKMVIADGQRLWMGGRNLAAEYFEGDEGVARKKTPWIDLSFDLEGALGAQAQAQFNQDWAFAHQQEPQEGPAAAANVPTPLEASGTPAFAQWLPSGPDQVEDTLYAFLVTGFFAAQSSILAVSPYYVPDPTLQMALTLAARRGIDVQLLLPAQSNHRLADLARNAALRELSEAGARIWLMPGMVHAKCVLIDEAMALAGSANLDERSLFLNYEVMVAYHQKEDVLKFVSWITRHRDTAQPYTADRPSGWRELAEGAVRWFAFQL